MAVGPTIERFCHNSFIIIYIHNKYIRIALDEGIRSFSHLLCVYCVRFFHCSYNKRMLFLDSIGDCIIVTTVSVGCF